MKSHISNYLLLFIVSISISFCSDKYPADSLLIDESVSFSRKVLIVPIAGWQRISHNLPLGSCQFHPSCSNYGCQSIAEHGPLFGIALTADRIVRCHPVARFTKNSYSDTLIARKGNSEEYKYHLSDPLPATFLRSSDSENYQKKHNPYVALGMSAILPGSGRMYNGYFADGLLGFVTFSTFTYLAVIHINHKTDLRAVFFGTAAISLYMGELIGAFNSSFSKKE